MTTTEEYTEDQILNQIKLFSEKVKNRRFEDEFPDGGIDGEYSNRGNKLKLGSLKVHRDRVDGHNNDVEDVEEVDYNNIQRTVVKRRKFESYDNGEDIEDDPYLQIDLLSLLAPIQQPSELVNRDSISKTYKSNVLRRLAQQAIEIIEKEQDTVIQLSSLLDIFLCEDTSQLLEAKLQLPVYEHNFNNTKEEETNEDEEIDLDKRITRRQSIQETSDPFFALPTLTMDPDFGLNQEDAEEARQLSQIALQRNEEFIRNLMNLRNGLSRAQYVKEKLFNWAKELNGDPDECDLYQKEVSNNTVKVNPNNFNINGVNGSKDEENIDSGANTPVPETKGKKGRRGGRPPAN